jgi:hypothetical protein
MVLLHLQIALDAIEIAHRFLEEPQQLIALATQHASKLLCLVVVICVPLLSYRNPANCATASLCLQHLQKVLVQKRLSIKLNTPRTPVAFSPFRVRILPSIETAQFSLITHHARTA